MLRGFSLALMLVCLLAGAIPAQTGFVFENDKYKAEIPFEYVNNFIIITVGVNHLLRLKFIYDTGAEYTLLSKRELADLMQLEYERTFNLVGSDMKSVMTAHLARGVRMECSADVVSPQHDVLVMEEDYFRFEEFAGVNVHGILAGNVFSQYIIKIDYDRKVLILYNRDDFSPGKREGSEIPVAVERNKIYAHSTVRLYNDSVATLKLLLDTGAGIPLLLFTESHPAIAPPPNAIKGNIGMGLGGYLDGFVGRVPAMSLQEIHQREMVCYFQHLDTAIAQRDFLNGRNGLLGNQFLERFVVTIDYLNEKIWLKPTAKNEKKYNFDRSGIALMSAGKHLNEYLIQYVIPGSPAADAGLLAGDEIIRVGWQPVSFMDLSKIIRKFKGKPGKKITLTIRRQGAKMRKHLVLRDLI